MAALYLAARERLAGVFAAGNPDGWKRERKAEVFADLREKLLTLVAASSFEPLNNARLASVGAYTRWLEAFERLLAAQRGDLATFYVRVEELARLPETERRAALAQEL